MWKGSKLHSILKFKCPKCQEGEFLETRNIYNLKKVGNLHEKCSCCGLKYEREVGFYYGAMYVSYGLGVALFVALWVAAEVLVPAYEPLNLVYIMIASSLIMAPILYPLSKIIWINLFVSYDRNAGRDIKK